ncbi:hypothetical protein DTO164E3_6899 [Paecilomyces variotii]|nr:hypothetical protein DTO032I3_9196 [Paecilomyces variotii]KAJ9195363.1 hypothetical protein DTO164E3_6899 [Paecilomyces variotii]KAJ9269585.1 hypothetical protein DTO212C5_4436 [Paecilomyces variotii]KAJ9273931.1 hypothetical protein DTO021D3_9202 [Paecilomyces variotii]KAJ9338256.1 hypothetical protein DTO027B6_9196 [Paecilomyces variotii]
MTLLRGNEALRISISKSITYYNTDSELRVSSAISFLYQHPPTVSARHPHLRTTDKRCYTLWEWNSNGDTMWTF